MAVTFDKDRGITRTSEYRMYPEAIKIKADLNGRHDLPDVEWLIQDILRQGQIVPVSIRNDGGTPVLCAGFSRWRAISEINKRNLAPVKMQVRCSYTQANEVEGFMANIAENRFRNSTTMMDDAHNIHQLLKRYAMTEEQIAVIYFPMAAPATSNGTKVKSPELKKAISFVKKRAQLFSLIPEAQEAIKDGRVKESAAMSISKLSEEQQKSLIKKSGSGNIKASSVGRGGKSKDGKQKIGWTQVKAELQVVLDTGKFNGIGNKVKEASDDMVEWIGRLLGEGKEE